MKSFVRSALLALPLIAALGCTVAVDTSTPGAAPGTLNASQEAKAKELGIPTVNGVKDNPGMYNGDVNFAKAVVGGQQRRAESETSEIHALAGKTH